MRENEFEKIVVSYAREIAEEIAKTPSEWHKEVYYDGETDEIDFSSLMTGNTYTDHPDKIGVIKGLHDIPVDWGVEYCHKCDEYHPVSFKDGEMEYNHSVNAWDQLVDILEDEIMLEPEAWVKPTVLE